MHVLFSALLFLQLCLTKSLVIDHEQTTETADHSFQDRDLSYKPQNTDDLGLVIDVNSMTRSQMFGPRQRKHRRGDKLRRRKDKTGKLGRHRNKLAKAQEAESRHVQRNNEKDTLVRNRTIEILKNKVRILSADDGIPTDSSNKSAAKVNETVLEKILSSAVTKQDLLVSSSGMYKLPIGGDMYGSKKLSKAYEEENVIRSVSSNKSVDKNHAEKTGLSLSVREDGGKDLKKNSKDTMKELNEDYPDVFDEALFESGPAGVLDGSDSSHNNTAYQENHQIGTALEQIMAVLQNLSNASFNCSHMMFGNCSELEYVNAMGTWEESDPCLRWLHCKDNLEFAFSAEHHSLPSCPCQYPSTIVYDDKIWDERQGRYFRWKDASTENEHLDVYKPGASYCIRSLLTQGTSTISSQHCCYDRELKLITRGSGAGTINFVSPDVSSKLHDTLDMLPWRLCKGDFTKYNSARKPDNRNNCPLNPDDERYQLQVEVSKYF